MVIESTPGRVLVIDDQPITSKLMASILSEEFAVTIANSVENIIGQCHALNPDAILLDVMMPGHDGYQICGMLKADPILCDIPVLFVTARSSWEDEAQGLQMGAADFVTKPYNPASLRARVRNVVALKRQRDYLARLSSIDGLTGIANRRQFDDLFAREWRRHLRGTQPLGVILLDIDHFKRYNDSCGHVAGDTCLRAVAQAIEASLNRSCDLAARYGGEEFICLLPETDTDGTKKMAERIGEAILALAIPHPASETSPYVTISRGALSLIPSGNSTPESMLISVDAYLYEAKRSGRNRTAGPDVTSDQPLAS
ncbi:diguanylate cyclase domain-containing protein [Lacibacterium aquatile]|uniref:diguanylate cyclase n=1 Tax=Lacibacterium aquatile TaxID=1168082 RepID=A0ABW5DTS9_9PROT